MWNKRVASLEATGWLEFQRTIWSNSSGPRQVPRTTSRSGPVFSTSSKANPDPVVGLDFIRKVRALTDKPIVAIGGITLERATAVIEAGADSVAVISGILSAPDPAQRASPILGNTRNRETRGGGLRSPECPTPLFLSQQSNAKK